MFDEQDDSQKPLDFLRPELSRHCPYCGEILDGDELQSYLAAQTNALICPNCRKRLNIHELGRGI